MATRISARKPVPAATKPVRRAKAKTPRAPGRPSGGAATAHRDALLDAARAVFARTGYAASSLRLIAQEAQVTPALAHYYFDDKEGLLLAVVEERVAPLIARIAALVGTDVADPQAALTAFVRHYTRTASENPWLPQLILREVLSAEGALREQFIARFATGMTALLKEQVRRGQKLGIFRRDLDPAATVMSIIALCIFPFIAKPLVSDVLRVAVDPAHAEGLAEHHLGVLLRGLRESA